MQEEIILLEATLVCILGKRFDSLTNAETVSKIMEKLESAREVVFDLERTEYISSAFFQLILKVLKKVGRQNLSIININSPFVEKVMKISNISNIINTSKSDKLLSLTGKKLCRVI